MDSALDGALIGLVVGLVLAVIGLGVAIARKPRFAGRAMPRRVRHFDTPQAVEQVRAALLAFAAAPSRYKLEEDVPEQGLITFGNQPTLFSWGFFFPCYLAARDEGGTRVTVGIASRLLQLGPVVTHHLDKACAAFEEAVRGGGAAG